MRREALTRLGLVVLGAAILVVGAMDCFASELLDAQAMQCCASMPCAPGNQSLECCESMITEQVLYVVPPATPSGAPLLAAVSFAPPVILPPTSLAGQLDAPADVSTHAPPLEFYKLYHSLLI